MFGRRPLFYVFGIPVSIDPMFLIGMFVFYAASGGGRPGVYVAVGIGIFTLIHELGHAVTAKMMGAEVAISLSFLVGWAQYSTARPLRRWQSALISVMGPLTQLVAAGIAFWVIRLFLLPASDRSSALLYADLHDAVMWSGVVIAVLNLLPLWPLDGGHIVISLVRPLGGPRGRALFLRWTVAASALMALASFGGYPAAQAVTDWTRDQLAVDLTSSLLSTMISGIGAAVGFALTGTIFIPLFCGFSAWQTLKSTGVARGRDPEAAGTEPSRSALEAEQTTRAAERQGWTTGSPATFPRGWGASPWLRAHVTLRQGGTAAQAGADLAALADPRQRWILDRWERPEIGALLAYVPPTASHTPAVVEARKYHGPPQELIDTALSTFSGTSTPEAYYAIAEGLAQRGLGDDAMNWLRGAVDLAPDPTRIATSRYLPRAPRSQRLPTTARHGRTRRRRGSGHGRSPGSPLTGRRSETVDQARTIRSCTSSGPWSSTDRMMGAVGTSTS